MALFLLFGNVSCGLLSIGLHKSTYRYYFKYKLDKNFFIKIHSSNIIYLLIIFSLTGLALFFCSPWFSETIFNNKIDSKLIKLAFLSGVFQYFFVYFTTLLTAKEEATKFAFILILKTVTDISISMYLIFFHSLTYAAKIYGHLLAQVLTVFLLVLLFKSIGKFIFSLKAFKKSFNFAIPQLPQNILGFAHQSFDKVMLTNYSSLQSLTHYTFGSNFAMPIKMIMDSFARSWNTYFLKTAEDEEKDINDIIDHYYQMVAIIFIAGLTLSYFSEELVIFLTTESFYYSKYIIPLYILYYLIGCIGFLALPQIMYAEKMIYALPVSIINIVFNIIFNIILIPIYGSIGAVISIFTSSLIASFFHFSYGQKSFPLNINKVKLVGLFIIGLIFISFSYPLMFSGFSFLTKIGLKFVFISTFIFVLFQLNYLDIHHIKIRSEIE